LRLTNGGGAGVLREEERDNVTGLTSISTKSAATGRFVPRRTGYAGVGVRVDNDEEPTIATALMTTDSSAATESCLGPVGAEIDGCEYEDVETSVTELLHLRSVGEMDLEKEASLGEVEGCDILGCAR